mgnify:CR=1 FL=1
MSDMSIPLISQERAGRVFVGLCFAALLAGASPAEAGQHGRAEVGNTLTGNYLAGRYAQARRDLSAAAEIQYGRIPDLESKLVAAEEAIKGQNGNRLLSEEVTEEDVASVVAAWAGIPVNRMMEGGRQKLVRMEERLHERVIGQDEAVTAVANAVRRACSGLQDPERPMGSFIFLGHT